MARSREKNSPSQSGWRAGQPGSRPADPVATPLCTHIWQHDSFVFRSYISKFLSRRKPSISPRKCCFPNSGRNSHRFTYISPRSIWRRSPIFNQRYFLFCLFLASLWLKKVCPHFISGNSIKKGSWSSVFYFKRSDTQK